eukprot:scaffold229068_cov37-Prasinocladus_malaysianus.AAC.2
MEVRCSSGGLMMNFANPTRTRTRSRTHTGTGTTLTAGRPQTQTRAVEHGMGHGRDPVVALPVALPHIYFRYGTSTSIQLNTGHDLAVLVQVLKDSKDMVRYEYRQTGAGSSSLYQTARTRISYRYEYEYHEDTATRTSRATRTRYEYSAYPQYVRVKLLVGIPAAGTRTSTSPAAVEYEYRTENPCVYSYEYKLARVLMGPKYGSIAVASTRLGKTICTVSEGPETVLIASTRTVAVSRTSTLACGQWPTVSRSAGAFQPGSSQDSERSLAGGRSPERRARGKGAGV